MPRQITKYGVFIATPGDVAAERDDIEYVINQWNSLHSFNSGVELETLRWEGNILPDIELRGQESINRTLLSRADLLICVFWHRIGGGGTTEELATFKGKKLAYFCERDLPRNVDLKQAQAVNDLRAEWQAKGAFIQGFTDNESFRDTVLSHLVKWVTEVSLKKVAPPTDAMLRRPENLQATLLNWENAGQPGTVLLFNNELSTFKSEDDFRDTWSMVGSSENIKRIIMVLPPHKKRRLIRYVSRFKDEFSKFPGKDKFEVADFPENDGVPPPTAAFAVFRFGDRPTRGPCHGASLIFLLTEPFSTREAAPEEDGFSWSYDVMLACSEENLIMPFLVRLLSRYFPKDRTVTLPRLLTLTGQTQSPSRTASLPGNRNQPAALDLRLKIREDLFCSNVPTYVLDQNYFLVDWNAAFDLIFAHRGFRRGDYVIEFLNCLTNASEVISRGKKFVGERPLFDDELFFFRSPEFGEMQFLKTTAQALNERGEYHGWNVALSLSLVEKAENYRKQLRSVVEYETLMGQYAAAYNRITARFSGYRSLAHAMADAIGDLNSVLDLGTGPAHLSKILASKGKNVVAIDANDAMLACAYRNCASEIENRQIEIHKANLESISAKELAETRSDNFRPPYDAAVLLNVFYAIRDKPRLLGFLRTVLKPGGKLVLSGPGDNVNLDILYARISADLPDELSEDFRLFREVNDWMFRQGLLTQTISETSRLLNDAGFQISQTDAAVFSGQGVLIIATAP